MTQNRQQQERQLLRRDELTLVEKTHNPQLAELPDSELAKIYKLLRDRRDKARQTADRQRREMRGKSEPKGSRPAPDNTGTHHKKDLLGEAMVHASYSPASGFEQHLVSQPLGRSATCWKQKRRRPAKAPTMGSAIRALSPIPYTGTHADWLIPDLKQLSDASVDRDRPLIGGPIVS
jgi:hypothetical protein